MYSSVTGRHIDAPISTQAEILYHSAIESLGGIDFSDNSHETNAKILAVANLFEHAASISMRALLRSEGELESNKAAYKELKAKYDALKGEAIKDAYNG